MASRLKRYSFAIGNSTRGRMGISARVSAQSAKAAAKVLNDAFSNIHSVELTKYLGFLGDADIEYVMLYFNSKRVVTERDLEECEAVDEAASLD